ncbi:hypothetical protein OFO07_04860 [Campylobacter sp. JMF_06 NA1]|uniref:hypothetical protein n=1 Tax=Campylobacter sp. JMF_06 NA1 TaxID=2983823 RepID=UPI0022E99822|nr:hypothetical protein [Campylobacter sp. JMF_06 NA1]MDA3078248.1 hypothetical protein [Campylobacter sp. JMF_06 NA1]
MKKLFSFALVCALFAGCAHKAEFKNGADVAPYDENILVANAMRETQIYIPADIMSEQTFVSSTSLGKKKDLTLSLGEFVGGETKRFIGSYLLRANLVNDEKLISQTALLIVPQISDFKFGFYSADGFDVTAKPFISYDLKLKILKNGKPIYNKTISTNERNFGDSEFFGGGDGSYEQLAEIFQKALANDYAIHAREIIDTINLAD